MQSKSLLTTLFLASCLTQPPQAPAQVLTRSGYPGQLAECCVVAADFNHDGVVDLAAGAFEGTSGVQVLLGKGDGTFNSPVAYAPGSGANALATADLNHDGNPDIVIANVAGDSITVLLGNGDGTFQAPVSYATPSTAVSVVVGDFNNDGKLDIAAAEQGDPCVAVLLGNGDGTFQEPAIITYPPLGAGPLAVTAGYFNGDGNLDLALTENFTFSGGEAQIMLGNGDGTFTLGDSYTLDDNSLAIVAADLRNNGKIDLVAAQDEGGALAVLLGNGDGTFEPRVQYYVGSIPYPPGFPANVAVGDMNGDGIPDLVSVPAIFADNLSYSAVYIFAGKGDGTFGSPETSYPVADNSFPGGIALGDFNDDGQIDIALADQDGLSRRSGVSEFVLLNTGTVKFSPIGLVSFTNQKRGTTSPPQTVTLTNQGKATLSISSIKTTGEFGATSTCGKGIAAKASCTISVTFSPKGTGEMSGTVEINDSASSKPQVIALSGKAY
jgi:hypothetical protein